jgi:adenylate cyclase class IV
MSVETEKEIKVVGISDAEKQWIKSLCQKWTRKNIADIFYSTPTIKDGPLVKYDPRVLRMREIDNMGDDRGPVIHEMTLKTPFQSGDILRAFQSGPTAEGLFQSGEKKMKEITLPMAESGHEFLDGLGFRVVNRIDKDREEGIFWYEDHNLGSWTVGVVFDRIVESNLEWLELEYLGEEDIPWKEVLLCLGLSYDNRVTTMGTQELIRAHKSGKLSRGIQE